MVARPERTAIAGQAYGVIAAGLRILAQDANNGSGRSPPGLVTAFYRHLTSPYASWT